MLKTHQDNCVVDMTSSVVLSREPEEGNGNKRVLFEGKCAAHQGILHQDAH